MGVWAPADGGLTVPGPHGPQGLRLLRCSFGLGLVAAFSALAFVFLIQSESRAAGLFGEAPGGGSLAHGPLFWLCSSILLSVGLVALLAVPDRRPVPQVLATLTLWSPVSGWLAWLPLTGVGLFYLAMVPGGWHLLPVLVASVVALAASVELWVLGERRPEAGYRAQDV